ncbi:Speckle-type POZ protein like [Argiope bruennichi]|uniref:Speckle-type POZ protein like n=1 Tax=Argiope bruennichi TaxID=94029 RepID=A0A8T0EEI3_ARGBR|nr:Speckle-type POZ protein like [Argiope bruennichi]
MASMHSDQGNEENCFSITWRIEKVIRNSEKINKFTSPRFVVNALDKSAWTLKVLREGEKYGASNIDISLHREMNGTAPTDMEVKYELSLVRKDGSVLRYSVGEYSFRRDKEDGCPSTAKVEEVIDTKQDMFFPQDVLTVRCRMWRKGEDMLQDTRCFARTRVGVEKRLYACRMKNFSTHELDLTGTLFMKSPMDKIALVSVDITLRKEGNNEVIYIEPTLVDRTIENASLRLSLLDASGNAVECNQEEFQFDNSSASTRFMFLFTRNKLVANKELFLPNDTLTLEWDWTFTKEIEEIHYDHTKWNNVNTIWMSQSPYCKDGNPLWMYQFKINNLNNSNEYEKLRESQRLSEPQELNESEKMSESSKLNESEKSSKSQKLDKSEELSESKELNESVGLREPQELNESEKIKEPSKLNEFQKSIESQKLDESEKLGECKELNESEELSEPKELKESEESSESEGFSESEELGESEESSEFEELSELNELKESEELREPKELSESEKLSESEESSEFEVLNEVEVSDPNELNKSEDLCKPKELKESEELSEPKELDESEELCKPKELKESEELSEPKELHESEKLNEPKELNESEKLREPNELKEREELNEPNELKEHEELNESKELKKSEQFSDSEELSESGESSESEDLSDSEESSESEDLSDSEESIESEKLSDPNELNESKELNEPNKINESEKLCEPKELNESEELSKPKELDESEKLNEPNKLKENSSESEESNESENLSEVNELDESEKVTEPHELNQSEKLGEESQKVSESDKSKDSGKSIESEKMDESQMLSTTNILSESQYLSNDKISRSKSLIDKVKSFYERKFLCDVQLKTSTSAFPAHKVILSAFSSVFKDKLLNEEEEKESDFINIEDLEDDTVKRMLDYIYTSNVEILTWESASKLYEAANKYAILNLKNLCSSYLKNNLSPSNACEILLLSHNYSDNEMKKFVMDFIVKQGKEILNSEWRLLMNSNGKLAAEALYRLFYEN